MVDGHYILSEYAGPKLMKPSTIIHCVIVNDAYAAFGNYASISENQRIIPRIPISV